MSEGIVTKASTVLLVERQHKLEGNSRRLELVAESEYIPSIDSMMIEDSLRSVQLVAHSIVVRFREDGMWQFDSSCKSTKTDFLIESIAVDRGTEGVDSKIARQKLCASIVSQCFRNPFLQHASNLITIFLQELQMRIPMNSCLS